MTTFDRLFPGRRHETPRARIQRTFMGLAAGVDAWHAWGPGDVRIRLIEAVRVAQCTAGRVGPAVFGSAWPEMQREWGDAVEAAARGEIRFEKGRTRTATAIEQLTRANEALRWQAQYLNHPELRLHRGALRLYLMCRATRRPFRQACKDSRVDVRTAERAFGDCCTVIAIGLIRANIRLDAVSLQRHQDIEAGVPGAAEDDEDQADMEGAAA